MEAGKSAKKPVFASKGLIFRGFEEDFRSQTRSRSGHAQLSTAEWPYLEQGFPEMHLKY